MSNEQEKKKILIPQSIMSHLLNVSKMLFIIKRLLSHSFE